MMPITGMFFRYGLTGSAWGKWVRYTASPLRAFENELSVPDAVGLWDPLGLTPDANLLAVERRGVEVKHGGIAMLATMGYITPKLVDNFPGYVLPSLGLKYAGIPNVVGKDKIRILT